MFLVGSNKSTVVSLAASDFLPCQGWTAPLLQSLLPSFPLSASHLSGFRPASRSSTRSRGRAPCGVSQYHRVVRTARVAARLRGQSPWPKDTAPAIRLRARQDYRALRTLRTPSPAKSGRLSCCSNHLLPITYSMATRLARILGMVKINSSPCALLSSLHPRIPHHITHASLKPQPSPTHSFISRALGRGRGGGRIDSRVL